MRLTVQLLGRTVKRLQYKHHRLLETRLAGIGTTLAQWDALRAIENHPDSISHDLALLTFQSDQSFGTLANRMVDRGLIERVPGHGRALLHRLTATGQAVLEQGHALVDEALAESFSPLTGAERQTLAGLLEKLLEDEAAISGDDPTPRAGRKAR
ncbi:MarR family winged helix-turn-helix transcriptional regulator [Piscinibacter terrae]|uniref:MarR family transcriptional regulator n=1 Tax=Piscinibacter terrae TaxID=2496871 RepID=A0A3N7HM11_9BURK|nr:MarR family winged helix-turn-helix transcriptional regulator [Albitalea terrae]RQP23177.1 MarR family transcriptional regulator [Albitalea terrae]